MQGTLIKYIATTMLMTLIIRTESGEEVTLSLNDDTFMALAVDHERASYIPADADKDYVKPDKITCDVENGVITKTIILKDGSEIVEE